MQVVAELISGTLHVSFTTDPLMMVQLGAELHNGDWYQLNITVISGMATVQLGSDPLLQADVNLLDEIVYGPVLLGSIPVESPNSFGGCVRTLTINGIFINLNVKVPYSENDPPFAAAGCPREENCSPNPCGSNGACMSTWDDYSCRCSPDYTGPTCSECKFFQ